MCGALSPRRPIRPIGVNDQLERMYDKRKGPRLARKLLPCNSVCLRRLSYVMAHVNRNWRLPGRDLNPRPLEYEGTVIQPNNYTVTFTDKWRDLLDKYLQLAEMPGVARVDHRTKCVS
jgi:hypothetical protein